MDLTEAGLNEIGVKKTYQMRMDEINTKLSSKKDWYEYLEKHL